MKKENALLNSISLLIGAVIAILALVRGEWMARLLIAVFALWGLWAATVLLLPYFQREKRRRQRAKRTRHLQAEAISRPINFEIPKVDNAPVEQLLLQHVNHRISARLQSIYGNATWEWCEKNPANLAARGGVGRIRIYGISDFDHADVTLNQNAEIRLDMMRIVPLSEVTGEGNPAEKLPPNKQPVDPQIWYEMQGRNILESLVADLNSRGHSHLTLHENGDVFITQDQDETPQEHLANFPAKVYWPRLVQVLESEGLAAEVTTQGISVSW